MSSTWTVEETALLVEFGSIYISAQETDELQLSDYFIKTYNALKNDLFIYRSIKGQSININLAIDSMIENEMKKLRKIGELLREEWNK